MTKTDYKYFEKAKNVANVSTYHSCHVGCVAVYQGMVVAIGCNSNKTHPIQRYYNKFRIQDDTTMPKLHAEINCINQLRHLNINYSKVKFYIYRARADRLFSMARPCPACMAAIKDLGIKHIYYTTDTGYAHEYVCTGQERGVA